MHRRRRQYHLPTAQTGGRLVPAIAIRRDRNLFWLGDHHVAVHENAGDSFVHTGEYRRTYQTRSIGDLGFVKQGRVPIVIFGTKWLF